MRQGDAELADEEGAGLMERDPSAAAQVAILISLLMLALFLALGWPGLPFGFGVVVGMLKARER